MRQKTKNHEQNTATIWIRVLQCRNLKASPWGCGISLIRDTFPNDMRHLGGLPSFGRSLTWRIPAIVFASEETKSMQIYL